MKFIAHGVATEKRPAEQATLSLFISQSGVGNRKEHKAAVKDVRKQIIDQIDDLGDGIAWIEGDIPAMHAYSHRGTGSSESPLIHFVRADLKIEWQDFEQLKAFCDTWEGQENVKLTSVDWSLSKETTTALRKASLRKGLTKAYLQMQECVEVVKELSGRPLPKNQLSAIDSTVDVSAVGVLKDASAADTIKTQLVPKDVEVRSTLKITFESDPMDFTGFLG